MNDDNPSARAAIPRAATCPQCHDVGWLEAAIPDTWPVDPHLAAPVDFGDGDVRWPCAACTDLDMAAPLRVPFTSQLDADLHVAGQWLAMRAVGIHFDEDGVHKGHARQQRALGRIERTTRTGHYRPAPVEHRRAA